MKSTDYASLAELGGRLPREKLIPGWPGYMVDELGRPWSCRGRAGKEGIVDGKRTWFPIAICQNKKARTYSVVLFVPGGQTRKSIKVRELVALAFLGPKPPGYRLCSMDGDPSNHRLSNLEYHHKDALPPLSRWRKWPHPGTGPDHIHALLTAAQVIEVRRRAHAGEKRRHLAKEFGVSKELLRFVLMCRTYTEIDAGVPPWTGEKNPDRMKKVLTPDEQEDIRSQVRLGRAALPIWRERYKGKVGYQAVATIALEVRPKRAYTVTKKVIAGRNRAQKLLKKRRKARDGKRKGGSVGGEPPLVG